MMKTEVQWQVLVPFQRASAWILVSSRRGPPWRSAGCCRACRDLCPSPAAPGEAGTPPGTGPRSSGTSPAGQKGAQSSYVTPIQNPKGKPAVISDCHWSYGAVLGETSVQILQENKHCWWTSEHNVNGVNINTRQQQEKWWGGLR